MFDRNIYNNKSSTTRYFGMKLDPSYLHFISREELRILAAIEMGMRNHQYVPADLIAKIGNLKNGETFKTIRKLLKNKFIVHIGNKCDGYKLTYLGYDYLALQTFMKRGIIKDVIGKIGVGKQSDIYKCITPQGEYVVLKLTRLGRNSFRSIKKNREYIQHRTNYNWLYLSRLSSIRQFLFMQLLYQNKFPTPKPIDTNRHGIVMSLIDGDTFCHIQTINTQEEIKFLFEGALELLVNFAKHGLIHGDYNQFNLLVNEDGTKLTVIDFPQCISIKHPNANMYFERDLQCIYKYFDKIAEKSYDHQLKKEEEQKEDDASQTEGNMQTHRFRLNVSDYPMPVLANIEIIKRLDHQIKITGHITLQEYNQLEQYRTEQERMEAQMKKQTNSLENDNEQENESEHEQENEEQEGQEGQREEEINEKEEGINGKEEEEEEEGNKLQVQFENIQMSEEVKQTNKYDEEIQNLINELDNNFKIDNGEGQAQDEAQEEESDEQENEEYKNLTPYQIRIKIKEEKRIEREKRKQAVNSEDFIKKALKRKYKPGTPYNKGNYGSKNKVKQNNQEIREGAAC